MGSQLVTAQNSVGEVFTALSTRPVQVRQNTEPVRLRGFEAGLRGRLSRSFEFTANTAYVRNNVKGTDEPAEFEGFAPPFISYLSLRYEPTGRRFWVETYSTLAYRQARYSNEDFEEQRTGAARSRNDIANFFNRGARARGLTSPGADNRFGTADDVLLPTGETLLQVQNRVLPGVTDDEDVALFNNTAGFATLNARFGYRLGERQTLIFGVENIFDKNYRINGSGVDSPGVNATVRYQFRF